MGINSLRLKADLTLLFVAVIWGSAFVAQRIAGQADSNFLFNGSRFLLAAAVVLPFVRWREKPERGFFVWVVVAGLIMFLGAAFQQAGLKYTTAGNAGFLTSLYVVIVPIILWVGWREKPSLYAVLAVLLASGGAFLLSTAGTFQIMRGDALEVMGAFFWAVHVVILGKYAFRYDPIAFSVGQFFVAGVVNLMAGLWFETSANFHVEVLIFPILYAGIISAGVGYTLQVWGQRHTPPTNAALILSLEAVFAVLAGWFFLQEYLLPIQLLGCLLIFAGVMLTQVKNGTMKSSHYKG